MPFIIVCYAAQITGLKGKSSNKLEWKLGKFEGPGYFVHLICEREGSGASTFLR